jgi:polysaccharide biosynthesis protein PslH
MKLLFLTCHLPSPPVSGGRRREYELVRRIGEHVDVELHAVTKTPHEDLAHVDDLRDACAKVVVHRAEAAVAGWSPTDASIPQVDQHRCADARRSIGRLLSDGDADLVHVEGFYLVQHLPPRIPVPMVLGTQNVEHLLWAQRAATAQTGALRRSLQRQSAQTARAERRAWQTAELCVTVTAEDRDAIAEQAPTTNVQIVMDGADHDSRWDGVAGTGPLRECKEPLLVMVGNFAYEPNRDAARFLIEEILPAIHRRRPDVCTLLVGNAPPRGLVELVARTPRVELTGRVPAVEPYLDAADVIVCPLRIGGGIKVKMLEALKRGKAIVASPVAMQGLERARDAVRVAPDATTFAEATLALLGDPARRRSLERASSAFSATLPTWDEAAETLMDCYRSLLPSSPSRAVDGSTGAPLASASAA